MLAFVKLGFWRLVKLCDVAKALLYQFRFRRNDRRPLFLDVGARGGPGPKWRILRRLGVVDISMVEPEPAAAAALRSEYPGLQVLEAALGGQDRQDGVLFVCKDPILSSLYEPDLRLVSAYSHAHRFQMAGKQTVSLNRFDSLVEKGQARVPDFIKLDVQGYELEVLRGFGALLDRVLAIELESQFFAHYKGQPLFGDINAYLMDRGFGLLAIRPQGIYDEACIADSNCFFARDWRGLDAEQRRMLGLWRRLMRIPTSLDMTLATG